MHGGICMMEVSPITCTKDTEMKDGMGISSAVQSNGLVPSCVLASWTLAEW